MHGTHRRPWLTLAGGCAAVIIVAARPAAAQTQQPESMYVTVSALADIKHFSGDPATNVLDGNAFGGSVAFGTSLSARWDLEAGVDASGFTDVSKPRTVTIRRSVITLQSRTRNRATSFAALVRYHAAPRGRLQIGYLGGLLFLRLERQFDTEAPADTPASLIPKALALVDYGAAPVVGVDARITVAAHVAIVPALQASAFQFHDVGGVLLRPRIGVRWTF